ncbi:MAG: hypothetical protein JNM56_34405 [Planctomycetia bacterium]|nr:hypothetical protein [Planctomycetia bacterium]
MRRDRILGLMVLVYGVGWLAGCSKQGPGVVIQVPATTPVTSAVQHVVNSTPPVNPGVVPGAVPELFASIEQESKTDGLMRQALERVSEKRYADALELLKIAQSIEDTEPIRQEIERVSALLTQRDVADKTVAEIRTVLKEGNAEEAAKLAAGALQEFGGGDDGIRLAQLKQQADALRAAGNLEDRDARRARFSREAEDALREQNLRAAALALEQAVEAGGDAAQRQQFDDVRGRLVRYDDLRRQAAELRRDPGQIEDAIAALQDAQKAWDTLQVRQDLIDYNLALQRRRERISVAEFETRGEVGLPFAGQTIAEELLPAFKTRNFDVVERAQLARVIDELKLQPHDLADNDEGRREVGRLGRVRYLVLGSVTPLSGMTIRARLVDLRTGLIVQTGKVSGLTPEDAIRKLPLLAEMLTLPDEQRIALENKLAQDALVEVKAVQQAAALPPPPPPPPPAAEQAPPPPPPIQFNAQPPALGGLQANAFNQIPIFVVGQPLPPPPPPQPVVVVEPIRQRFLHVSLEIGDNLFRRGRYREAQRHFEFALNLAPGEIDIRLRIDRVRPFLPPPPPVVIAPVVPVVPVVPVLPPPVFIKPRVAIFNFAMFTDPRLLPAGFTDWVSAYYAQQFAPWYDVIDRGELFWHMGRLGLTVNDVLTNFQARRWLAQALDVRFFIFGTIQQTASYDVSSHIVDAETGQRTGTGKIHVQDHNEMKLRMAELVQQLRGDPGRSNVLVQQSQENERQLNEVRRLLREGQAAQAVQVGQNALRTRPNDVALRTLVLQAEKQAQQQAAADRAKQEAAKRQSELAAARKKQEELALAAELARQKAEEAAKNRTDAAKQAEEAKRDKAHAQLLAQADVAFKKKDFSQAISLLQSAVALKPTEESRRQLAQAKAQQESVDKLRLAEEKKQRDAEKKKLEEAELAKARAQIEEQKKAEAAAEAKRRKEQEARDEAAQAKLLENAQDMMKQEKFDSAIQMLSAARQLKATPEVDKLLKEARDQQARVLAAKKGAEEKSKLEAKLAEEKANRDKVEAENKKKQEQFSQLVKDGQKALQDKQFDEAATRFQEAGKLFRTDVVLNGQRAAQQGLAQEKSRAEAEKKKKDDEAQRSARIKQLLTEGQTALAAKNFDKAIKTLQEAKKLEPTNIDVLAALDKAEDARDDAAAEAARLKGEQEKLARVKKLLTDGQAKLKAKNLPAAESAAQEALKLKPGDAEALALLKDVANARSAGDTAKLEKELAAKVQKLVNDGEARLKAKDFSGALASANEALKLKPNDAEAAALLKSIEKARNAADLEAKTKEDDKKRAAEHQKLLLEARQLLAAKKFDDAIKLLQKAQALLPTDQATVALLKDAEKARKDQLDLAGKDAEVDRLVKQGRTALAAKDFASAGKAFGAAAKLSPKDPDVLRALQDLQKAESAAKADADAAKKREGQHNALLAKARQAMTLKRLDDAVALLAEADKVIPGDKDAAALRLQVEKARQDAQNAAAKAKQDQQDALIAKARQALTLKRFDDALALLAEADKLVPGDKEAAALRQQAEKLRQDAQNAAAKAKADEQKRLAEFKQAMAVGQKAMASKRYDEAVKAFSEALKGIPNEPTAMQALAQAQKALEASKIPPKPNPQAEAAKFFQSAAAAEQQQNWDAAAAAYREVLKLVPNDPKATAGLRNANFQDRLGNGNRLLAAKKFAAAAKEFEAALQIMPGNPQATDGLKKAKAGK